MLTPELTDPDYNLPTRRARSVGRPRTPNMKGRSGPGNASSGVLSEDVRHQGAGATRLQSPLAFLRELRPG